MSKPPFRVAQPGRNPIGQYSPQPAPNPMAVYNGAAAAGVDMQTYLHRQDRVHDHLPEAPVPAPVPGAPPPMRLR
jgi:hypothetical protein